MSDDPLQWLATDRNAARDANDPMAAVCSLALVVAGRPSVRTLVLREADDQLAVFVNATSPKYAPLMGGGWLEVLVWLPSQQVQYRLTALPTPIPAANIASQWQFRPTPAKRLDWYYTTRQPQSSIVASRDDLVAALDDIEAGWTLDPAAPESGPAAPDTAAGFYLDVRSVERLFLDEVSRVHDRRLFRRRGSGWRCDLLVP